MIQRFNAILFHETFPTATAHPSPQPKRHLDRLSRFRTGDRRVSLYFTIGRPFPLKIASYHGGSELPSNTWFFGPTRVLNPNGISIDAVVFAGLTSVTDQHQLPCTDKIQQCRLSIQR